MGGAEISSGLQERRQAYHSGRRRLCRRGQPRAGRRRPALEYGTGRIAPGDGVDRARAGDLRTARPGPAPAGALVRRHRRHRRLRDGNQRDLADRHPCGEERRRTGHRGADMGENRKAARGQGRMTLRLTIATTDYDHFRDFRLGLVRAEGITPTWLTLGHHEIFARFTFNREWDVSELSFAKFVAQVTREESDIIGLPVYASRMFRFSSVYINRTKGIKTASDLRGKRVGVPEWAHTAAVYMRGWLMHEGGVPLSEVDWIQAGTNEAGRGEKVELNLSKDIRLTRIADKTLSDMIAAGEIDAAIIARPPNSFRAGHPDVTRLFPDYEAMEQRYYAETRVYPIMHVIALRKTVWNGRRGQRAISSMP